MCVLCVSDPVEFSFEIQEHVTHMCVSVSVFCVFVCMVTAFLWRRVCVFVCMYGVDADVYVYYIPCVYRCAYACVHMCVCM